MKKTTALLLFGLSFSHFTYSQQPLTISDFATQGLTNWTNKKFSGTTIYSVINMDNIATLKAISLSSASGVAKEQRVDLKKTPYINWSWRVDNRLLGLTETSKKGDDYAARLYVVKNGGWLIWKTLALNYVWSSNQKTGSTWNNAYAGGNAKMLAVRGKNSNIKVWQTEKRDVYADLIAQFGDKGSAEKNEKAYRYIDAIALMTDTDNSQLSATAYYRNIYFSAD